MQNEDTIHLLKECDAGTKMAVTSINEVLDKTKSSSLNSLLADSKGHHEKLGDDIHRLLMEYGSEEKDPSAMAKGMSWMKTNIMMGVKDTDAAIADVMTDGCNMGVKSLYRYMNKYPTANESTRELCHRLVSIETELCGDFRSYLQQP